MENCFKKIRGLEDKKVSLLKKSGDLRVKSEELSKAILVKYYLNRFIKELIPLFTYSPIHFKKAFTLAEVLITLGIIGVVAALTMPTLISKHNKLVTESRIKKAYSLLYQAMQMSQAENGASKYWEQNFSESHLENSDAFTNKYILPYLKGAKLCGKGNYETTGCTAACGGGGVNYYLPDGSSFSICKYLVHTDKFVMTVAVNNKKDPENGRDKFSFIGDLKTGRILPIYYEQDKTKDDYLNGYKPVTDNYTVACNESSNAAYPLYACTAYLYYNGWKIPDNYPFKF